MTPTELRLERAEVVAQIEFIRSGIERCETNLRNHDDYLRRLHTGGRIAQEEEAFWNLHSRAKQEAALQLYREGGAPMRRVKPTVRMDSNGCPVPGSMQVEIELRPLAQLEAELARLDAEIAKHG